MAQRIEVLLLDDIDGTTADSTVGFALDDQAYEIDLNADHDKALRGALAPYIEHARRTATGKTKRGRTPAMRDRLPLPVSSHGNDPAVQRGIIRDWAKTQPEFAGISTRGRLAANVIAAYKTAHA
jgi:hypothetical protein